MSVLSVQDWQDFMYQVGEDFFDLVHDTGGNSDTPVDYPSILQYKGAYLCQHPNDISWVVPVIGDFNLTYGNELIFKNYTFCINSNLTPTYIINWTSPQPFSIDMSIEAPHSYVATGSEYEIYQSSGVYYVAMKDASGNYNRNIFHNSLDLITQTSNGIMNEFSWDQYGSVLKLQTTACDILYDYNGYDYYFQGSYTPASFQRYELIAPIILKNSPCLVNRKYINSTNFIGQFSSNYYVTGDTNNTYTYYIDNDNYITTNYITDSNGVPTGYIDINPTGEFSFDDLFDMFNTILAPLVGVGLDLPDWNDYLPPVVTGDINVNIDLPDVTGEYPSETITPIDSDVYNIMSIDSLPQLPSLTGIDNGETAVALGSSFSFLDGCGLLMPFVTIAIIRLLISKFRGDS